MSIARTVMMAVAILGGSSAFAGSDLTLTHSSESGLPGSTVTAQVTFDNVGTTNLRGWSYGVCVDTGISTVNTATTGSTTSTINLGAAPEFESINFFPDGLTHGVVICFSGCAELLPGSGYELLEIQYDLTGPEGASGTSCFCDTLGVPPIETIFADPVGTALVPTQQCGTLTILDPPAPVSGASCTPVELTCSCNISVSWTNGDGDYDSINIYRDAVLVDTLAGSATFYNSTDELGNHTFCIEPVRGGLTAPQVCCSADCPDVSVPTTGVTGLNCVVDDMTCTATVTWGLGSSYTSLEVLLDGVSIEMLSGSATSTTVSLGGPGSYSICIDGVTVCDDPIVQECCMATCAAPMGQFQRGDYNGDGTLNIADPVALLGVLFSGETAIDCQDALDGNDDGGNDIGDAVYMLTFLFNEGTEPPAPFGVCGPDPTADAIDCNSFPGC